MPRYSNEKHNCRCPIPKLWRLHWLYRCRKRHLDCSIQSTNLMGKKLPTKICRVCVTGFGNLINRVCEFWNGTPNQTYTIYLSPSFAEVNRFSDHSLYGLILLKNIYGHKKSDGWLKMSGSWFVRYKCGAGHKMDWGTVPSNASEE